MFVREYLQNCVSMKTSVETINLLKLILNGHNSERTRLIQEFQEFVWNDDNSCELLSGLAYDLEFYEPNEEWRNEDPCYYGEERLEHEIKVVLQKLEEQRLE